MTSRTTHKFRKAFRQLPESVQKEAREAYRQFIKDPFYPGLHFKRIHASQSIYSVRINEDYRAVGILENTEIIWFWIGSHNDYSHLLTQI